jgi:hypothetical protein
MKTIAKNPQYQPVLKVKTTIKAGYYLGITLSAGAGAGPSTEVSTTGASGASGTSS